MSSLRVLLFLVAAGHVTYAQRLNLPLRNPHGKPAALNNSTSSGGSAADKPPGSPTSQVLPVRPLPPAAPAYSVAQSAASPIRGSSPAFSFAEDTVPSKSQSLNGSQPAGPTTNTKVPIGGVVTNGTSSDGPSAESLPTDFEGASPGWGSSDVFANGDQIASFPQNSNFVPMPLMPMPVFPIKGSSNDTQMPSASFPFPCAQCPSEWNSQSSFPGPMGSWSSSQRPEGNGWMHPMPSSPFDPSQLPPFVRPPQEPQRPGHSNENKVASAILRQILKGGHVKVKLETKTNLVFEQSSESEEDKKPHGHDGPQAQWEMMNMAMPQPYQPQSQMGERPGFSQTNYQGDAQFPMGMMPSQMNAGGSMLPPSPLTGNASLQAP
ncbi:hypothetical protein RvY_04961 [Ramazzottius varieornatus]|uniref:Uncharacterized protein n=1 Tax=Ramazzottius varieornatus TaxID=947166 RepID=A0A1D1UU10_RAMVA|nr:hypothetical protein RvY_04961 [Ramazzottius varieornatus]